MDLTTVFTMLGGMAAIMSLFTGWINRRFNSLEKHHDIAMGRIDATNARIDITQAIIMRMLEKQGK